jgi:hypothetical protein
MSSLQNFLEIVPVVFGAGESKLFHLGGAYFEIIDAPSPVDVVLTDKNGVQRGVMRNAEASFYIKNTDYDTVQLTSATAQTIRFAFGSSEAGTRRSTGSVTISGSVALDAATLAALESIDLNAASLNTLRYPLQSNQSWTHSAALSVNTAVQIFAPGSNVNGAVILTAGYQQTGGASNMAGPVFICKSGAPTSITDGEVICCSSGVATGTNYFACAQLPAPQIIAPGLGLYLISQDALNGAGASTPNMRHCRYRLL